MGEKAVRGQGRQTLKLQAFSTPPRTKRMEARPGLKHSHNIRDLSRLTLENVSLAFSGLHCVMANLILASSTTEPTDFMTNNVVPSLSEQTLILSISSKIYSPDGKKT